MVWWKLALIIWGILNVVTIFIHLAIWIGDEGSSEFGINSPAYWYCKFNINWFGAIIIYILTFIICFIWSIGSIIYSLFTVGRR